MPVVPEVTAEEVDDGGRLDDDSVFVWREAVVGDNDDVDVDVNCGAEVPTALELFLDAARAPPTPPPIATQNSTMNTTATIQKILFGMPHIVAARCSDEGVFSSCPASLPLLDQGST